MASSKVNSVYIIGSLRNPQVPEIGKKLRAVGLDVFDDWYGAGPEADDKWKEYEQLRGRSYQEALQGFAAKQVFEFDKKHLDRCEVCVLVYPAGRSGHLEFGYSMGKGKKGFILIAEEPKIEPEWLWLTGLFEGEGSLTRNGDVKTGHAMSLSITMKDEDIIRRAALVSDVGRVQGPYRRNNPKWSDMWRWSVYRKEDILFVLNTMWEFLGIRRKEQITRVLKAAGVSEDEMFASPNAFEFRWDVMTQFATVNGGKAVFSVNELVEQFS